MRRQIFGNVSYNNTLQVVVVTPDLSFSRLGLAVALLHFSTGLGKTILNARTRRKLLPPMAYWTHSGP